MSPWQRYKSTGVIWTQHGWVPAPRTEEAVAPDASSPTGLGRWWGLECWPAVAREDLLKAAGPLLDVASDSEEKGSYCPWWPCGFSNWGAGLHW